jgi:hypothetical protein
VDEFDQDDACRQMDEGQDIPCGLLAAQGDAFEALEFADGLLDTGTGLVKVFGKEAGLALAFDL